MGLGIWTTLVYNNTEFITYRYDNACSDIIKQETKKTNTSNKKSSTNKCIIEVNIETRLEKGSYVYLGLWNFKQTLPM